MDHTFDYYQLIILLLSEDFDFDEGGDFLQQMQDKSRNLAKFLYDPSFRILRNQLPKELAVKLNTQFQKTIDIATKFHMDAGTLSPLTPSLEIVLRKTASEAIGLTREFIITADLFAEIFAYKDQSMSKEDSSKS